MGSEARWEDPAGPRQCLEWNPLPCHSRIPTRVRRRPHWATSREAAMHRLGIVGAGIGGTHLALYLQQQGVPASLYAERTPDEHRALRLSSTPGHYGNTRAREAALGVNHW